VVRNQFPAFRETQFLNYSPTDTTKNVGIIARLHHSLVTAISPVAEVIFYEEPEQTG
jgi:hypothetical protein